MNSLAGKRALVTGASGGLGKATSLRLAQDGVDLVLFARRAEELEQTANEVRALGVRAVACVGDVCTAQDRAAAFAAAQQELGGLDLLINNAGVGAHGRFHESDPERLRRLFEVNLFAVADMIRESIPLLSEGTEPAIVNIGSVLGWRGAAHNSEYCASKFALRGLSESIRPELGCLGIHLLHVSPGPINTEFFENLIERRDDFPWATRQGVSAEYAASRVVRSLVRKRNEVIFGWQARWFVRAARWAPRLMDRVMSRYG